MKKMAIYEPAMCCPTGLCGVSVDPELLRVSTVINTLGKNGVKVERYNLSSAPHAFINNKAVNAYINTKGAGGLPVTTIDGQIVISGRYPANGEFAALLGIPESMFGKPSSGCGCDGSC